MKRPTGGPRLMLLQRLLSLAASFVCGACTALILVSIFPLGHSPATGRGPSSLAANTNAANHERDIAQSLERARAMLAQADPGINSHNKQMTQLAASNNTNLICSTAIHHIDLPFPWFIFKPTWNCLAKERVGDPYDGGKWHCNVEAVRNLPKCIVYSLGSDAVVGYELAIRDRTDCEIHVFDPTVSKEKVQPMLPTNAFFHEIGIAGHTGTMDIAGKPYKVSTIKDIMTELGHARISVLKMDIEGYEYAAIEALARTGTLAKDIDELLIEFHWRGAPWVIQAFERILRSGFRIFSLEPNLFYRVLPATGIEYSFVHERVADAYNV